MVPGMTERERLAADSRRREWMAETPLPPMHSDRRKDGTNSVALSRLPVPLGLRSRSFRPAILLGQRSRLARAWQARSIAAAATPELG
jgi:hypothetical protein